MMKTLPLIVVLVSLATSLVFSSTSQAGTELLFTDHFNTADSGDPNLNLATRQTGTLATRTYTNVRGAGSIAGNQLLMGSDSHSHVLGNDTGLTAALKDSASTRFSISFDAQYTSNDGWSSPYLSTHGAGGEDRGESRIGLLLFADGTVVAYTGAGGTQTSQGLNSAQLVSLLGSWDIKARNNYSWVATKTTATTGTYRLFINGKLVLDALPYVLNNTTTLRWNVRNVSGGAALYDNLEIERYSPHPLSPVPEDGAIVPGGNVALSWTNFSPNTGTDVWVDVWFGTNPASLTKVVNASLNATTTAVNVSAAGTYYWRVDSYLDGAATGTPVQSPVITFIVLDSDGDSLPDSWEQTYFNSPTAADPNQDFEPDGLTNLQEYTRGTHPKNADTDADGLTDSVESNTGTWVSATNTGTSPRVADSDADGLMDGRETHTGTWVSSTNTGTHPLRSDTDADGLKDGAETNTGTYLGRTNTGSNPHLKDTDTDGAGDWYEAVASLTNPSDPTKKPNVPYPLPDPDGSTGAPTGPVKVYILSGQSNMVGMGNVAGIQNGTLETIAKRENKFPNLVDGSNNWTARNDVIYQGVTSDTWNGPLRVADGAIGPELGFGHVVGSFHNEPVLIIKASDGNRSLGWDFCPPGSPRFNYGTSTYAGYGDNPEFWATSGGSPVPGGWYAGLQYDQCFLHKADWSPAGSAYADVFNAADLLNFSNNTLQNLPTTGNNLNGRNFEIAGFVWFQGHKDQYDAGHYTRYETNLINLRNALRADFNAPDAPFVVATIGFGGQTYAPNTPFDYIWKAQMAVGDPSKHPELASTVRSVDTLPYWRSLAESPTDQDYHYHRNAETYMLVGDALGRAMIDLQVDLTPPTPSPMTFAIAPSGAGSGSAGMVATPASDPSGPVQYWFENTTNGNNSGWITTTTWTNTGLSDGSSYNFRVKARDSKNNETAWSGVAAATAGPDATAPLPNPMSFASAPAATGMTTLTMTATTASDFSGGVQYFFDCTAGGGPDSGWQASALYAVAGLSPSTAYTYVVRAKDSLGNTTANSSPASAVTASPNIIPVIANPNFDPPAEDVTDNAAFPGYGLISAWTRSGAASGVNSSSQPFLSPQAAPSGSYVAFIQGSGNISQNLTGFDASKLYTVTYFVSERGYVAPAPNNLPPVTSTSVSLDGGGTSYAQTDNIRKTDKFRRIVSSPLAFSGTSSSLRISATGVAGDNTLLIDTVSISRAAPRVPDNGFENPVQPGTAASGYELGNGTGSGTLTGSLWNFGAGTNGITRNGSTFSPAAESAPEGSQAAILSGVAEFSNTVAGFEPGVTYSLSFAARGRAGAVGPNTVQIQLGGMTLKFSTASSVIPGQSAWTTYTTDSFTTAGGNLALKFIGLTSGDKTTFIDDVRFNFVTEAPANTATFANYVANPSFGIAPSDRDFGDDPDGDSLANGLEAWFGTHPGQFNSGLTNFARTGNTITFTHPHNEALPSDVTGYYQWSPNLTDWYAGNGVAGPDGGPTVTITSNSTGATTTVTATLSNSPARIFLRAGAMQN